MSDEKKKPLYEDHNTLLMRCEENEKKIKELEKKTERLLERIEALEEWKKNHSASLYAHSL